jgi:V/A-type H+-transporting ATPase subunit D
MAKFRLSKSALQEQRSQLRLYERLLPSLDMKRRQLVGELAKARASLQAAQAATAALDESIGGELPMLGAPGVDLAGLVRLTGVRIARENVAGVKVPRLTAIDCEVTPYSDLGTPAWVDHLVVRLQEAARQRLAVRVEGERVRVLERTLRRITQRVNLYGRVLIPGAKQNIKRIQIHLGDLDREGVIRSKLAKSRHGEPPPPADVTGP